MLRLASGFPDAVVGLLPALQGCFDGVDDKSPGTLAEGVACARVLVDAVDDGTEDVELFLLMCGVADAHGLAAPIAGEVVELALLGRRRGVGGVEDRQRACWWGAAAVGLEDVAEE